jgi:hypothetical protein
MQDQEITPTQDRIEGTVEPKSDPDSPTDSPSDTPSARQALMTTSIEMKEFGRLNYEPLIDEPVTGSGNDDLWVPECDPAKQGSCPAPAEPSGKTP